MAIGEAAVTVLSDRGVPTPVVHTRLVAPASRMGPSDDPAAAAKASPLWPKYGTPLDARSAREILAERLAAAEQPEPAPEPRRRRARRREPAPAPTGGIEDFLASREGKALQRKTARGVFGMLRKRL